MDWSKPRTAGVTIVLVFALAIVVHVCLMMVYYLRSKIYMKFFYKQEILPTTSHSNSSSVEFPTTNSTISMVFGHENKVFDLASEKKNVDSS